MNSLLRYRRPILTSLILLLLLSLAAFFAYRAIFDDGSVPRSIPIAESDLGPERALEGLTPSGVFVRLSVRPHHGKSIGFWCNPYSPPWDILWTMQLGTGPDAITLPPKLLRDIGNIINSPNISTIEDLLYKFDARPEQNGYIVTFAGGDGHFTADIIWRIRRDKHGALRVTRHIEQDTGG